jgi:triosephosphate isomerase (TIM)
MQTKKVIVGNWKMYKTIGESVAFVEKLLPIANRSTSQVMLAVPFTALERTATAARGSQLLIGAQNMHDAPEGAFTGEISAKMIVDAGGRFVLLGHSERRALFHESDDFINRKVKSALAAGLRPILCVGESLQEHESGRSQAVVEAQLKGSLAGISADQLHQLMVAYEPVWAIGTGKTATPAIAQAMHHQIRQQVGSIKILYGGSVKPENVKELLEQQDIDGVLVGGASLSLDSFVKIVDYRANCKT